MSEREHEHEPVGSLGEEAVKLFDALGDWARNQSDEAGAEHLASDAADCTWCPMCRTAHALRQTSPEVREQLLVAATALLQVGTGLLASLQAGLGHHPGPRQAPHRGAPSGRVEHIDLDDETGADDPDDNEPDDNEWES